MVEDRVEMGTALRWPIMARQLRKVRTCFCRRRPAQRQPRPAPKKQNRGTVSSKNQARSGSIHRQSATSTMEAKPKMPDRMPPTRVRRLALEAIWLSSVLAAGTVPGLGARAPAAWL